MKSLNLELELQEFISLQQGKASPKLASDVYQAIKATAYRSIYPFRLADSDREDVVSHTQLNFWKNLHSLNYDKLKSWVQTTAKNKAIDILERKQRLRCVPLSDWEHLHTPSSSEWEGKQWVDSLLKKAAPKANRRDTFIKSKFEDFSLEELEQQTGVPKNTIAKQHERISKRLKKELAKGDL